MKNMKYKNAAIAMAVLTFVFSVGVANANAGAMRRVANKDNARRAEMALESIEASDYETWRRLINPNSKLARQIDEMDFKEFVRARNLARQGRYQEAVEIYEKLKAKIGLTDEEVEQISVSLDLGL